MDNKVLILRFIQAHFTGTLATADPKGIPDAATVDFAVDEKNLNLIFNTAEDSLKYRNLSLNPRVCVVFSDANNVTIKYYGFAHLAEGADAEYLEGVYEKSLVHRVWKNAANYKIFKITPVSVKYTNYTSNPPRIVELKFD